MPVKFPLLLSILLWSFNITAGANDFPSSRSDGLGETVLISEPSASEVIGYGVPLPENSIYLFDFGYKREYQLQELDNLFMAAAVRHKNFTLAGGISQFGDNNLYTEKNYCIGTGYGLKEQLHTAVIYYQKVLEFNNRYPSIITRALALSFSYRRKNIFWNCLLEYSGDEPIESPFSLKLNTEIVSSDIYHTIAQISVENNGEKRFGLGEKVELTANCSIMFGYVSNPKVLGGGIIIKWEEKSITYTTANHPVLGFTHTISLQFELLKRE